jgi:HSP20 family protein
MFNLVPFRSGGVERRDRDLFDIDSIFENFFHDTMFPAFYANSGQMKVDIKETEKAYVVEAEIPGVQKDEINLEIEQDRLTISVNKNEEINEEKENYIRKERRSSAMTRSFTVDNIIPEQANAKYENGVLAITLPKKETVVSKTKKIEIK